MAVSDNIRFGQHWLRRGPSAILVDFNAGHICTLSGSEILCALPDSDATSHAEFETFLSGQNLTRRQTVICLPEPAGFMRTLVLPVSAKPHLRKVVANQLDQLTPFPADQLYFDAAPTGLSKSADEHGMMDVLLIAARRNDVEAAVQTCREWGLAPQAVIPAGVPDTLRKKINLLPQNSAASVSTSKPWHLWLTAALVLICIGIGGLIVKQWIDTERLRSAALPVDRGNAHTQSFAPPNIAETRPLQVADILTLLDSLIPPGDTVTRLQINDADISLSGFSMDPEGLVQRLNSQPQFENLQFNAPVVFDTATGMERYQLTARIVSMP